MARKRPTTGLRGLTRAELLRETNPATARLLSAADARTELRRRDRLAARPSDLGAAFRARREQETARFRNATDSEYWVALCFETRWTVTDGQQTTRHRIGG